MTDLATYLFPSFIAGAVFLVIVGVGAVGMLHLRYRGEPAERVAAARSMRHAGLVVLIVGVMGCIASVVAPHALGSAVVIVPGALVADGALFVIAGRMLSRR